MPQEVGIWVEKEGFGVSRGSGEGQGGERPVAWPKCDIYLAIRPGLLNMRNSPIPVREGFSVLLGLGINGLLGMARTNRGKLRR